MVGFVAVYFLCLVKICFDLILGELEQAAEFGGFFALLAGAFYFDIGDVAKFAGFAAG